MVQCTFKTCSSAENDAVIAIICRCFQVRVIHYYDDDEIAF